MPRGFSARHPGRDQFGIAGPALPTYEIHPQVRILEPESGLVALGAMTAAAAGYDEHDLPESHLRIVAKSIVRRLCRARVPPVLYGNAPTRVIHRRDVLRRAVIVRVIRFRRAA